MTIIRFHNRPPKTAFAPTYDYFVYENDSAERLNLQELASAVLAKEHAIISSLKFNSDWGTGLGANSLTSRSDQFNLLEWPEAGLLKKEIKRCHNEFLEALGISCHEPLYAQCWANVLRPTQQIKAHSHYLNNYSYLGGHLCVQTTNTKTYYAAPYTDEPWGSDNFPGKITLFPNWIRHWTDVNPGPSERITIAWDLITKTVLQEDVDPNRQSHWVEL